MRLAIQVVAVLAAGALVLILARRAGVRGKQAVGAVAVIPVVAACLFALPIYREQLSELLIAHRENANLTARDVRLGNGMGINADVEFLAWAKRHLADGETFGFIINDSEEAGSLQQWALFQLAPHVDVDPPAADWVIYYEVNPEEYAGSDELEVYRPGFAIVRSHLAG